MCDSNSDCVVCFFFKQKTPYEMRVSDWSSDVCASDLPIRAHSALIMQMALPPATIQDNEKLSMTNADSCGPSAKPPSCAAGIKTAALPPSSTAATVPMKYEEIGRASCRERVCKYV